VTAAVQVAIDSPIFVTQGMQVIASGIMFGSLITSFTPLATSFPASTTALPAVPAASAIVSPVFLTVSLIS
jgi:hypothetical protein